MQFKIPQFSGARLLTLLSLLSGMGSVVYEVLYMRYLTSVLGDMYYVHATLLAVFLFALGVGSLLAHRFVRWLWAFEAFIAGYALGFPYLLQAYETSFLYQMIDDPVVNVTVAVGVLLTPPAMAIGFSVPLFSRYIEQTGEEKEPFGLAYYSYNFGAAISIVLVEFFVIQHLSYSVALMVIAALNAICAVVLFRGRERFTPPPREAADAKAPPGWHRQLSGLFLLSLSAALFHGFYLVLCYHLFLPFRENFAICTAAVLLGIAVGTDLHRRYHFGFRFAALASMGAVLVIGFGLPFWPELYNAEMTGLGQLLRFNRLVVAFLLGGLPYVFLGAAIPALVSGKQVERAAGQCLFVSGVGNTLGFLGYAFLIHPNLPATAVLVIVVVLLSAAWWLGGGTRRVDTRQMAVVGVLVAGSFGLLMYPQHYLYSTMSEDYTAGAELDFYKDGLDSVSYLTKADGRTRISYNGHPSIVATEAGGGVNYAEILVGVTPAFLAPDNQDVLVFGMGTGLTGGAAARAFKRADVVEINRAFWPVVERLAPVNYDLLNNPDAHIHHQDGRRFIAATDQRYDAVINTLPSPIFAAAGKLYTVDFFERVERVLKPGGIYTTWFTTGDMSPAGIRSVLHGLDQVFEHCAISVLRPHYYYLACSDQPIQMRPIDQLGFDEEFRSSLSEIFETDSIGLFFHTAVLSLDILENGTEEAPLNTDDHPVVEYAAMRQQIDGPGDLVDDPLITNHDRWGIRVDWGSKDERTLEQARILEQLHKELFDQFVMPALDERGLAETYRQRWPEPKEDGGG
jgi:spermidine synthase